MDGHTGAIGPGKSMKQSSRWRVSQGWGIALLLACMGMFQPALAAKPSPDGVWDEVAEAGIARSTAARQIVPHRYRTLRLSRNAFDQRVMGAPMERDVAVIRSQTTLSLPMPDGSYADFRIAESPVMAPALAKKYPQIRTWVAQGVDDPSATARLDMTPKGFHAQIISWQGTSYVDPYQPGDTDNYIAYRKNDYDSGKQMLCEVDGSAISSKEVADPAMRGKATALSSGANLRTYRLAVAATGEYTVFHGGSVVDGLSGIVSTINRVTGIYEREVSVRFQLVANEDQIIFTDAGSDPYANTSGDLSANVSTINSIIGSANYDVGHLVGTGGGGVASLGVICTGSKASGLTGSPSPVGDAFDVDYVAHEMGHQFGGNHTFNGSGVNCSSTNRNASTAYEPGSGITIQAYAGICGGDDLQPHSEDYFHRVSLNEIIAHTTSGSGGTCGVLTATGNAVPTVSTGASYTIPAQTPFELTASGNDGDGDALTYLWEEFDLGARNTTGSLTDDGSRPLFRSFTPSPSPSRALPSWRYILNNANTVPASAPLEGTTSPNWFTGELLPSTTRTMNFRVTVRDNRAGGGGTNEASTAISIVSGSGPFRVTAPNTAVSWAAGSTQTVTWNVASTSGTPINAANVRITLSVDGGLTWPYELSASTPNDGSQSVTIPGGLLATTQARVRVQGVGNVFFDVSDANFGITSSNTAPTITATGTAVSVQQGGPAASANVATVSDGQDAAASLPVTVSGAPDELTISSIQNNAGSINLTAQAACTLVAPSSGLKVYPLQLTVEDSGGAMASTSVNVNVSANRAPTLGTYGDLSLNRNEVLPNAPTSGPDDVDGNFDAMSVSPSTLPGGGTINVAANGTVTVTTTAGTAFGSYSVEVSAVDDCGAVQIQRFMLTVAPTTPVLAFVGTTVTSGNGLIEPNECNQLSVTLENIGIDTATAVSATVSTSTPNVSITQPVISFADIPAGEQRTSLSDIEVSTDGALVCLSNIDFDIDVTWAGGGSPLADSFTLPVGQPSDGNYDFTSSSGASIPAGGSLVSGSAADDALADITVPAGFSFSVYGTSFSGGDTIRASTNGTLQMTPSGGSENYIPMALPTDGSGDYPTTFQPNAPVLMPYWDDLMTNTTGGGIYTQLVGIAPDREWIVEWRGRHCCSGSASNLNFAIVFHEGSNLFDFIYAQVGTGSHSGAALGLIGVQAASTGSLFTQYSLNTASVSAGTKLSASIPPSVCNVGSGICSSTSVSVTQTGSGATEGGATDSYDVVLNAAPSSTVSIAITPDAQVQVSPSSLSFTTVNWATPQTVTVTAVDDRTVEGAHTGSITHAASGGGYDGVAVASVNTAITDNDSATYAFSAASSSVGEAAGTVNIAVGMSFNTSGTGIPQLSAPISIPYSIDGGTATGGGVDYTLAAGSLNINTAGAAQNISIDIVDDAIVEASETVIVGLGNESGGSTGQQAAVTAGSPASHTLTITDNDVPSVTITQSGGSTTATEGGSGDSYSVVLGAEPSGTVTINITPDTQVSVLPTSLQFNAGNWSVAQIVNVSAVDDAVDEGPHSGLLSHSASGGGYDGVSIASISVSITDNDGGADLAISNIANPTQAVPGETVSFEVTVNNLSTTVDVPAADLLVDIVPALDNPQWSCVADPTASCPANGTGLPSHSISMDRSSGVMYTISADVPPGATPGTSYVATASITIDASQTDPNSGNNSADATVTVSPVGIFSDGFESP